MNYGFLSDSVRDTFTQKQCFEFANESFVETVAMVDTFPELNTAKLDARFLLALRSKKIL